MGAVSGGCWECSARPRVGWALTGEVLQALLALNPSLIVVKRCQATEMGNIPRAMKLV